MAPKHSRQAMPAAGTMVVEPGDERGGDGPTKPVAEIKAYGMSVKIPLPKWAVTAIAAVIVAGLIGGGVYYASTTLVNKVPVSRERLSEYQETAKHAKEPKEQREENVFTFPDTTRVTVIHHHSDGCDQIVRWIPAKQKGESLWIFGPGLTPERQGTEHPYAVSDLARATLAPPAASIFDLVSRASMVSDFPREALGSSGEGQARCLDPHPGRFREQGQPAGQCITKVWRYFEDGCYHYQFFNPCAGTWDVYPSGAPRVYWQRCIH